MGGKQFRVDLSQTMHLQNANFKLAKKTQLWSPLWLFSESNNILNGLLSL